MKHLFWILLILAPCLSHAQDPSDFKIGKITATELSTRQYAVDTGAGAVILSDIGHTQIKGNDKGGVSLEFKRQTRIHILRKSAFDQATIEFRLYKAGDDEEQMKDLKAVTYNVENGKVVETKLSQKSAVFDDKIDRNSKIRKFAFPNVKEGSIIEFEYRLISDFLFNLQPWEFQHDIPCLWSQYTVSLPQFLDYVVIEQSSLPYAIKDQKQRQANYFVESQKEVYGGKMETERLDISSAVTDFRWAQKNIPAFSNDEYISSPANYISALEFQLAGYRPPFYEKRIMTNWPDFTKSLLERSDFGQQLKTDTYWLPDLLAGITKSASTNLGKAEKIYDFIQNKFSCSGYNQLFTDDPLDKIVDRKRGGVAELNLLLTCLLRGAGMQADPVILSTRKHGKINNEYPVFSPFNYVICRLKLDGKEWLLDASQPKLGFGKLHESCYNGTARVVNEAASTIDLEATKLLAKRQMTVFVYNDPGNKWTASIKNLEDEVESRKWRIKLAAEGEKAMREQLMKKFTGDIQIDSLRFDSVQLLGAPVVSEFLIRGDYGKEDILYINPVLTSRYQQNPFKSANRQYPVEMPFRENELYTCSIEIPEGYVVDEMPKPRILRLNSKNDIVFEYNVSKTDRNVMLNYKYELNRTEFGPEEYNMLREFFASMMSKLQEQIVCKRK